MVLSNGFIIWVKWTFLFLLWESKLKKQLRAWHTLKQDMIHMVKAMLDASPFLREEKAKLNLGFTQYWP